MLKVLENGVLRRTLKSEEGDVRRDWMQLYKKELHDL
jgi:hypothetical protein